MTLFFIRVSQWASSIVTGRRSKPKSPAALRIVPRWPPIPDGPHFSDFHLAPGEEARPRNPWPCLIAALLAVTISSFIWLPAYTWKSTIQFATAAAPKTVRMADGSLLRLGPYTQIELGTHPTALHLRLEIGAVLCDMTPNPLRNFAVLVDGTRIDDVATIFSVAKTMTGIKATVVEGRVQLSSPNAAKTSLSPNQQAFVNGGRVEIERLSPEEMSLELSLELGDLELKGEGLSQAVKRLNFYNRHDRVEIAVSPDIADLKIGGTFPHPDDPAVFVKAIVSSHPNITEERKDRDGKIILSLHHAP
jgi:ferric-dicitrate binding protein FerR (iron transport regulator)